MTRKGPQKRSIRMVIQNMGENKMSDGMVRKKRLLSVVVAGISLSVLCAYYLKYIEICGFHVPIMDFYRWISMYGEKVHSGTISFMDFFFDVNEQMQPGAMAIYFSMMELFDYDMWPMVLVGNVLLCLKALLLGMLVLIPFLKKKNNILFGVLCAIGIAMVSLNPNQWELAIEPFTLSLATREFLYYAIFILFSFLFTRLFRITYGKQVLYMTLLTVVAIAISLIMSGAYFIGLMGAISICGCILIIDQQKQIRPRQCLLGVIWALGVLGTLAIYLRFTGESVMNSTTASVSLSLHDIVRGWCIFWGGAFVPQNYSESSLTLFYVAGAIFTIVSAVLLFLYFRKGLHRESYFPLFLLVYGIVIALILIVGRGSTFGIGSMASSRYCVESCIGVSGALIMLAQLVLRSNHAVKTIPAWIAVVSIILSGCLCFHVEMDIAPYRRIYQENLADCMRTIEYLESDAFGAFQAEEKYVRSTVEFLRKNKLSIFKNADAEMSLGEKGYQAISGIWEDGWASSEAQMLMWIGESGYSKLEVYIPFGLPENERIIIVTKEKMLLNEVLSS